MKAEEFFLNGMTHAIQRLAESAHPAFAVTVYYAFKQSESKRDVGIASTGWETFLDAASFRQDFAVTGTWPVCERNLRNRHGRSMDFQRSGIQHSPRLPP